ncbi:MAG: hypothetical protein PF508_22450 [Spirochaeta sp.]|jgi:hypothetical protein|nr:hypothetical protein [Spirochaeta sp.]
MKRVEWKTAIAIITGLTMIFVLSGCEDLLGNEDDDEKDGNLTV